MTVPYMPRNSTLLENYNLRFANNSFGGGGQRSKFIGMDKYAPLASTLEEPAVPNIFFKKYMFTFLEFINLENNITKGTPVI